MASSELPNMMSNEAIDGFSFHENEQNYGPTGNKTIHYEARTANNAAARTRRGKAAKFEVDDGHKFVMADLQLQRDEHWVGAYSRYISNLNP